MQTPNGETPHLSLVIPVYNGERQLNTRLSELSAFVTGLEYSAELILVDDHSAEPAASILREFAERTPAVTLLRNEANRGKGFSVRRGMLAARGSYRVFTDADLAYPLTEVTRIVHALQSGVDVAIACRVDPESRYLISPSYFHYLYTRHLMSRTYNRIVRTLLLRGVLDTQAGLKGFSARAADTVFQRVTIPRFGFDVEALYVAQKHGFTVGQLPVTFRYDNEPSTVNFVRAGLTMAGELVQVKLHDWRGHYE